MEVSESQRAEIQAQPFIDLIVEFPFPKDLFPKHAQAESKVPLMTLVDCVLTCYNMEEIFHFCGGCGGHFLTLLGGRDPEFTLKLTRSVVSSIVLFLFSFLWFIFISFLTVWSRRFIG